MVEYKHVTGTILGGMTGLFSILDVRRSGMVKTELQAKGEAGLPSYTLSAVRHASMAGVHSPTFHWSRTGEQAVQLCCYLFSIECIFKFGALLQDISLQNDSRDRGGVCNNGLSNYVVNYSVSKATSKQTGSAFTIYA